MGHPNTSNKTPFAFEPLFLLDEQAQPVVTIVVKGTFLVGAGGVCRVADQQIPVNLEGETFGKDSATSSFRYEPEVAFFKPATDVVMNGSAYAPRTGTSQMTVSLSVGPLRKDVRVFGERVWFKTGGSIGATRPAVFEKIPLVYERAFGGWDRSDADQKRHGCEPRNPVGVGFRSTGTFEDALRLPNLEDAEEPVRRFGDRPAPAGFGFVSPHWEPRAKLAGTYDQRWQAERLPLLPRDFDRRYLNAASPGLVAPGYLRGDEQVTIAGASARGTISFALPGLPPPAVQIALRRGDDATPLARLDTVIFEPDDGRVLLIWRACVPLSSGPHDVTAIAVSTRTTVS